MSLGITTPRVTPLLFFFITLIVLATAFGSILQPNMQYQDRGNRYEGIKGSPVSDSVELISATVNYNEKLNGTPDQFKLKFYLSEQVRVFVRVRELYTKHNYWMDKLIPASGWRQGFDNEFQWPTEEVIKRLGIQLDDLGAVAQLDSEGTSVDMRVAPVILFSSQLPGSVAGYSFTFRIGRKADVTCSFSKDQDNSPVISTKSFEMPGQHPRTVSWNASNAEEGWYRLRIDVIYLDKPEERNQIIHFYHQPDMPSVKRSKREPDMPSVKRRKRKPDMPSVKRRKRNRATVRRSR